MELPLLKKLVANLVNTQRDPKLLASEIEKFLSDFRQSPENETRAFPEAIFDVLADLAMDLEYYVADPKARAEDASYFGDEMAMEQITAALRGLKDLGIDVESSH